MAVKIERPPVPGLFVDECGHGHEGHNLPRVRRAECRGGAGLGPDPPFAETGCGKPPSRRQRPRRVCHRLPQIRKCTDRRSALAASLVVRAQRRVAHRGFDGAHRGHAVEQEVRRDKAHRRRPIVEPLDGEVPRGSVHGIDGRVGAGISPAHELLPGPQRPGLEHRHCGAFRSNPSRTAEWQRRRFDEPIDGQLGEPIARPGQPVE